MATLQPAPCAAFTRPGKEQVQTFVAKTRNVPKAMLAELGRACVVTCDGAVALVETPDTSFEPGLFLVVSLDKAHKLDASVSELKQRMLKLPGEPDVLYVRPLTRRLQRLFHWGDVCAKHVDVEKACKAEDVDELLAIMPQARRVIERDNRAELALMPQLHDALQSPPALEDCQHEFFQEHRFEPAVPGPCPLATPGCKQPHTPPFTRCRKCRLVRCILCARTLGEKQEEREDILDLIRECQKPLPPALGAPVHVRGLTPTQTSENH